VGVPFIPGEKLGCILVMPGENARHLDTLKCDAEVVRIAAARGMGFGLGCRIQNVCVVRPA